MIGLIFATRREAAPFLALSRSEPLDDGPWPLYEITLAAPVLVAVSGMGKIAAAAACQHLIREQRVSRVINAGVCGALQTGETFQPGALFEIVTVVEGDHGTKDRAAPEEHCPGTWSARLPKARLVTCDRPVFDAGHRLRLAAKGDLADMEGAAVARVAALFRTPWTLIKAVTDGAGAGDRETLLYNLDRVSKILADHLWKEIGFRCQEIKDPRRLSPGSSSNANL
jgi:nucleoside phosphorylase